MPTSYSGFNRPDIQTIRDRVFANIDGQLPDVDSSVSHTPLNALAEAVIGASHEMYGYLNWIAQQTNIKDCQGANLDKYGEIWSVHRKPSSFFVFNVTFTGTNGTIINDQTILKINDYDYVVVTGVTIAAGTATSQVRSIKAGKQYNAIVGAAVTFSTVKSGVNSTAYITSIEQQGVDEELDEPYRQRILDRIAQAPHGGNKKDYKDWALSIPGVTRVWVTPSGRGLGTVDVRFVMDDTYSNSIPLAPDVAIVQNYIDTVKPICADVMVYAPTAVSVNLTISSLNVTVDNPTPDVSTAQLNIAKELKELFKSRIETGSTLYYSWLYDAISNAPGVDHFILTSPSTNITSTNGQLLTLGTITYG